jgi:hypothetical protein
MVEPPDKLADEEGGEAQAGEATVEAQGTVVKAGDMTVATVDVWSLSEKKFEAVHTIEGPEGKKFLRGKSEDIEVEQDGKEEVQQGQAEQGTQEEDPE